MPANPNYTNYPANNSNNYPQNPNYQGYNGNYPNPQLPNGNSYSQPVDPRYYPNAPFPQQQPSAPACPPLENYRQSTEPQPEEKQPASQKKSSGPKLELSEILSRCFVGLLSLFVVCYMGWLFAPRIRNSMTFWPTNTPTPITPTPTLPATATVTPLPTNTPTMVPTATPGPISTYWIASGADLDPAVPDAPEGLVILSAKNSADVDPSFDSIYWTSSSQIVQDLGKMNSLYDGEWFATLNSGSIRYYMDQVLKEGLYEIYVMDTYFSSGGSLDFTVKLGEQTLMPLTGKQTVDFMTSQYEPMQTMDTWRSLGIYYILPSQDVLTVSTSWDFRDEYSYVAADKIMIVPRKMTDLQLLNALPNTGTKYIIDDTQASILPGNTNSIFKESAHTSWDDSYQMMINPKANMTVEYSSKEPLPIGAYSVYLYIPENKGGLDAEIQFFTDNTMHSTINDEQSVKMHIPTGGSWVLVGQYKTDRYYEYPVRLKVVIKIAEGQTGEYPIDALAFIHTPFGDSE